MTWWIWTLAGAAVLLVLAATGLLNWLNPVLAFIIGPDRYYNEVGDKAQSFREEAETLERRQEDRAVGLWLAVKEWVQDALGRGKP